MMDVVHAGKDLCEATASASRNGQCVFSCGVRSLAAWALACQAGFDRLAFSPSIGNRTICCQVQYISFGVCLSLYARLASTFTVPKSSDHVDPICILLLCTLMGHLILLVTQRLNSRWVPLTRQASRQTCSRYVRVVTSWSCFMSLIHSVRLGPC